MVRGGLLICHLFTFGFYFVPLALALRKPKAKEQKEFSPPPPAPPAPFCLCLCAPEGVGKSKGSLGRGGESSPNPRVLKFTRSVASFVASQPKAKGGTRGLGESEKKQDEL